MTRPRTIVIVTYNSEAMLDACLAPLSGEDVLVVDNASSDESALIARRSLDEDSFVELPANIGYARAVNTAARLRPGRDLVLVNPDTVVSPGVIDELARTAAKPGVGAVAPRLLNPDGTTQDNVRTFPSALTMLLRRTPLGATSRGRRILDRHSGPSSATQTTPVDWALGALVYLRRDMFDELGGFDERYFVYQEDIDLGLRMRARGWTYLFRPELTAIHAYGRASRSTLDLRRRETRIHWRSVLRFTRRHPTVVLFGRPPRPSRHDTGVLHPVGRRDGVGVIVVTHDSHGLVEPALDAVFSSHRDDLTVVIVDDCSSDTAYLDALDDDDRIELIRLEENVGFAKANNIGIAALSGARHILLLNHDALLTSDTLAALCAHLDDNPAVGGVAPLLERLERPELTPTGSIDSAGIGMTWYGRAVDCLQGQPLATASGLRENVDGLSAACVLFRSDALASVTDRHGTFDDRFFMYKEDVDLSLRLRRSGWRLDVRTDLLAGHARGTSATSRRDAPRWVRIRSLHNDWRVLAKGNLSRRRRLAMLPYLVAKSVVVYLERILRASP